MEWWFNGFQRFPSLGFRARKSGNANASGSAINMTSADEGQRGRKSAMGESEYVSVGREASSGTSGSEDLGANENGVNGEKVEMEMARERKVQAVRTVVSAVGFMMGVVGIWGDGA